MVQEQQKIKYFSLRELTKQNKDRTVGFVEEIIKKIEERRETMRMQRK